MGQARLLGPGTALRRAIEAGQVHSMILWGPPGCGKTTLALLLARYADAEFESMSAVLCGLPEVREAVARAQARADAGRRTVLFIDEVHRFNKVQQDAFLPHVERGTIILVGATTENPSFELNSALLSRCRVHVHGRGAGRGHRGGAAAGAGRRRARPRRARAGGRRRPPWARSRAPPTATCAAA